MKLHHLHHMHHGKNADQDPSIEQPNNSGENINAGQNPDVDQVDSNGENAVGTIDAASSTRGQSKGYVIVAIIYLLGLCMGALDMGIVNPARTVIQNTLGVDDTLGVWILTIYTLGYAASIPIMGKLADRHGRKYIYLTCILLFGGGSALCGVAHDIGSFQLLICARAIQALGGGGIMPVATAEFGTAFPEEKRGMALGMVGMVYGLASIFGSSAGSLILDIFGQTQWQFIFYVNIPICIVIFALGIIKLPNRKMDEVPPIDVVGACVLTVMTLSLMYGLKNIDFFDLSNSIQSTDVYPFLIAFAALLPVFILVERRAKDPVINLSYFSNPNILIALVCSIISGVIMMGTIFFPQFAENSLFLKSGAGGYFIMILGLGSGFGAMLSGKLIDKHGVKPVLGIGFVGSLAGSLFMALVACNNPNLFNVCAMLALTGLGLGFTMGTPLNYMMLQNTADEESNSALATLSLVRSIGTAVAPAIMVAFVAHAGLSMQDNIMAVLPDEVSVSPLPHAAELDARLDEMRKDEDTAEMLKGIDIPKLMSYTTMDVRMDEDNSEFDVEVSDEMLQKMQDSDVTTIVATCKDMAAEMFGQIKPQLIEKATSGIDKGITAMQDGLGEMNDGLKELTDGIDEMEGQISEMQSGISDMGGAISGIQSGMNQMDGKISQMEKGMKGMEDALSGMDSGISEMDGKLSEMKNSISEMDGAIAGMKGDLANKDAEISGLKSEISDLENKITGMKDERDQAEKAGNKERAVELDAAINDAQAKQQNKQSECEGLQNERTMTQQKSDEMQAARNEMQAGYDQVQSARTSTQQKRDEMKSSIEEMQTGSEKMQSARNKMKSNRDKMQSARDEMQSGYGEMTSALDEMKDASKELQGARDELADTISKLKDVKAAIPGKFDEAEQRYLEEIDEVGPEIQEVYRSTLNDGFKGLALFVAACAAVGLLVLVPYREKRAKASDQAPLSSEDRAGNDPRVE